MDIEGSRPTRIRPHARTMSNVLKSSPSVDMLRGKVTGRAARQPRQDHDRKATTVYWAEKHDRQDAKGAKHREAKSSNTRMEIPLSDVESGPNQTELRAPSNRRTCKEH